MAFPTNPADGDKHEENGVWFIWVADLFGPGLGGWDLTTPPAVVGGLPIGGVLGQLLAKASATDFDAEWIDPIAGGGYVHTQTAAAGEWQITHNLGFAYVSAQVVSAGNTLIPDVRYTSNNVVTLLFAEPVSGTAILRR